LLGGFALVWAVVGSVVLSLDLALHQVVDDLPALAARPWVVAVTLLGVAGAVQLAPSTRRRLAATRRLGTIADSPASAFRAGCDHGTRCLRADGPVMIVMFAVGGGLGWMALLTAVMTAERSSRAGARLVAVTGVALMGGAVLVAFNPSWAPVGATQ
jgi:predicted metal-binding membrane protein